MAPQPRRQFAMKFIVRGKGTRRWNLPVEFPLIDSDDLLVLRDRRKLPDRRKKEYDLNDFSRVLSNMATKNIP
jgi:hypothetical protein